MSKIKQPYTPRPKPKYSTCQICKSINGDYRILHQDAHGCYYCLGCRRRDQMIALHEDQR